MDKKSIGMGFVVWFFFGGLGGHFVYGKDKWHYLLWFWIVNVCTLGIAGLVTAFFIPQWIREHNQKVEEYEIDRMVKLKEALK